MAAEESLNQSIERAVRRYSSLFKLPSFRNVLLLLSVLCIGGGLCSTIVLFPSFDGLISGLFLGLSLLAIDLVSDIAVDVWVLKEDSIYDLRRTTALSTSCLALWFLLIFAGVIVAVSFGLLWWVRFCLLGFSAVVILRLIVFNTTSFSGYRQLLVASLLQPLSCIVPFFGFWVGEGYPPTGYLLLFLTFSLIVGYVSSFFFILFLNRVGKQTLGVPSLSLFKAFLLNWIAGLNTPLEQFLEKLGREQNIEFSIIRFDASKPKAVIVIPSVHPGPFRNVGSSLLPSTLKAALEKELKCPVCVPHGLLGHEFDLTSQLQSQKIITHAVAAARLKVTQTNVTPFVKVRKGPATACCQIFGDSAFISFSLAPRTTEDFPQELGTLVSEEATNHGLNCLAVVNAHNSINGRVEAQKTLDTLRKAASTCLAKTVSLKSLPFHVGAATIAPKEFSLKDGMGPGGITVIVIEVARQKTAYIVIDGNNMISGLREKILSDVQSIGINEGEVFTTDTHSVNAIILNKRGYNPIGEVMNHERLVSYIRQTTLAAMSDLEPAKARFRTEIVSQVKVIGANQLETLCLLADRTLQKAKKILVPIFATTAILLTLVLTCI